MFPDFSKLAETGEKIKSFLDATDLRLSRLENRLIRIEGLLNDLIHASHVESEHNNSPLKTVNGATNPPL
jgi:hypothetical protein